MRGCSGTDEYESGREKITVYSLQKYTFIRGVEEDASNNQCSSGEFHAQED